MNQHIYVYASFSCMPTSECDFLVRLCCEYTEDLITSSSVVMHYSLSYLMNSIGMTSATTREVFPADGQMMHCVIKDHYLLENETCTVADTDMQKVISSFKVFD